MAGTNIETGRICATCRHFRHLDFHGDYPDLDYCMKKDIPIECHHEGCDHHATPISLPRFNKSEWEDYLAGQECPGERVLPI